MSETKIIGIDCATVDAKVGLALALVRNGECQVRIAQACSNERAVVEIVAEWLSESTRTLIALDAPLGWPATLGTALVCHQAGEPLDLPANDLFRRATDRFIKARLGKQSLDVGADRIARTAHTAVNLLADLRRRTGHSISLAWEPDFPDWIAAIEVYPAATLIAHGIPAVAYKKADGNVARSLILERLGRLLTLPADQSAMERNADALDACLCLLAGYDFLNGDALPPEDLETDRKEGWIWAGPSPAG